MEVEAATLQVRQKLEAISRRTPTLLLQRLNSQSVTNFCTGDAVFLHRHLRRSIASLATVEVKNKLSLPHSQLREATPLLRQNILASLEQILGKISSLRLTPL